MTAIIAGAEVVFEFCLEFWRDGGVLEEDAVFAIAAADFEGFGGNVFGDPDGVTGAAVVGGDEGFAGCEVVDGAGEAYGGGRSEKVGLVGEEGAGK